MSKQSVVRFRIAPLQRVVAEAITEPADLAALDRARARARRAQVREAAFCLHEFLDHVEDWKVALHDKLESLTPAQRQVFWEGICAEAKDSGIPLPEVAKKSRTQAKGGRRTK
jgi:hypothetical protein